MRLGRIFIFIAFAACLAPGSARAEGSLFVEGIRFGMHGGKTRLVLDFSDKPDFRAFLLDGPHRLAVDLPPVRWKVAQGSHVDEKTVKGYRSGALDKDGLTRIVFDLRGPAVVENAFVLPKTSMAKDRIVIDLAPASQNLFTARTRDVYGNAAMKGGAGRGTAPQLQPAVLGRAAPMESIMLPTRKPEAPTGKRKYTVVIDPGHGGGDPGAVASGIKEKNLTLAVAKELKRQLDESGRYVAVLTRDRDAYIKLRDRVELSRKAGADLFISIHADKIGRDNVRGASIYTLSEKASDAESARLAESENAAGVVAGVDLREESQDVADILLDLAMREKMNESNFLAQVVADAFTRKNVQLLPNSHRSAGFAVLKAPDVPAILIETGFLSNPQEAKLLNSPVFQRKVASAMLDGIDAYFRKIQALNKAN